jgi:hypothetical protein
MLLGNIEWSPPEDAAAVAVLVDVLELLEEDDEHAETSSARLTPSVMSTALHLRLVVMVVKPLSAGCWPYGRGKMTAIWYQPGDS